MRRETRCDAKRFTQGVKREDTQTAKANPKEEPTRSRGTCSSIRGTGDHAIRTSTSLVKCDRATGFIFLPFFQCVDGPQRYTLKNGGNTQTDVKVTVVPSRTHVERGGPGQNTGYQALYFSGQCQGVAHIQPSTRIQLDTSSECTKTRNLDGASRHTPAATGRKRSERTPLRLA